MRLLTRSSVLATVGTNQLQWVFPTRLATGLLLLSPIDGGIGQLFGLPHAQASTLTAMPVAAGLVLRGIEILTGVCLIAGLGIRLAALPAAAIFVVRALSDSTNSFAWLRELVDGLIVPQGDWAYGAMYLALALLLHDLQSTGSGAWSVDRALAGALACQSDD